MILNDPPVKDVLILGKLMTRSWARWCQDIYRMLKVINPSVSSDNGDNDVTLVASSSAPVQRWNTTLTANRTVTLSSTNVFNGSKFRIVREAGSGGAFDLDVGGLKTLSGAGEWADVTHDGTSWRLTAHGSL